MLFVYCLVSYEWKFNDAPLDDRPQQDGTLVYVDPDRSKQGYYQCIARNSVGAAFSNKTQVLMAQQASFPECNPVTRTVKEGDSLTLNCQPTRTTVPSPRSTFYHKDFEWRYDDASGSPFVLNRRAQIDDYGLFNI